MGEFAAISSQKWKATLGQASVSLKNLVRWWQGLYKTKLEIAIKSLNRMRKIMLGGDKIMKPFKSKPKYHRGGRLSKCMC